MNVTEERIEADQFRGSLINYCSNVPFIIVRRRASWNGNRRYPGWEYYSFLLRRPRSTKVSAAERAVGLVRRQSWLLLFTGKVALCFLIVSSRELNSSFRRPSFLARTPAFTVLVSLQRLTPKERCDGLSVRLSDAGLLVDNTFPRKETEIRPWTLAVVLTVNNKWLNRD